jgi:broad specificity phosphatase PhoE
MLTFYLVRHGTKESLPFDPPLTELGIKQAELTAKHLKNISFKKIIVSHKLRTQQTAGIIAKHLSLPIFTDSRLRERLEWEYGKTFNEFWSEWQKTDIDRNYKPEVGESSNNKGKSMKQVLGELSEEHKDGNVLIVAHGGSIADLLRNLFEQEDLPHVVNPKSGAKYMDIRECSVTIIQKFDDEYKLLKLGDISHLSAS